MRKWRRIFLIGLLIVFIISGIFEFLLAKSGFRKLNVLGSTNVFDLSMLFFSTSMVVYVIFDIYLVYKGKRLFSNIKFSVLIQTSKLLKYMFIMLVIVSVGNFIRFALSPTLSSLPSNVMVWMVTVMYGIHYNSTNAIGENGIFHLGAFHSWEKVKSYEFKDENLLNMKVVRKVLGLKYDNEIKLIISSKEKDEINKYIKEKVG